MILLDQGAPEGDHSVETTYEVDYFEREEQDVGPYHQRTVRVTVTDEKLIPHAITSMGRALAKIKKVRKI